MNLKKGLNYYAYFLFKTQLFIICLSYVQHNNDYVSAAGTDVHKGFNKNSSTDGNRIQNPHIRNMILFFV